METWEQLRSFVSNTSMKRSRLNFKDVYFPAHLSFPQMGFAEFTKSRMVTKDDLNSARDTFQGGVRNKVLILVCPNVYLNFIVRYLLSVAHNPDEKMYLLLHVQCLWLDFVMVHWIQWIKQNHLRTILMSWVMHLLAQCCILQTWLEMSYSEGDFNVRQPNRKYNVTARNESACGKGSNRFQGQSNNRYTYY